MFGKYKPYFIIIIFGLLLYAVTIFFDFSFLDDNALILDNYEVISDVSQIGNFFTNDVFFSDNNFYYRPLFSVSLFLDTLISGNFPWFFHLMNVWLHIIATCLVFSLLKKLKSSEPVSFFLSLLFLFHPALAQAVAWIPGRNDSLLTIFIVSAFIYFLNFLKEPLPKYYIFSLLFFIASLFTKETAIFLPLLAIFYYLLIDNRKMKVSDVWMFGGGLIAVTLIWIFFRSLAINGGGVGIATIILSILENSPAFIVGLGKFIWPVNLSIMSVLRDVSLVPGIFAVLGLIILGVYKKGAQKKFLAFGLLWFLLFFLPSLINPDPETVYYFLEHRLYLPFVGLLIIISQAKFLEKINYRRPFVYGPAVLILFLAFFLSARHLPDFKNRLVFWQSAVKTSPSAPMPARNLGVMLYFENRQVEALTAYYKALEINPKERMVHNNIGVIYMGQGLLDEAESEFNKELEINPGYDRALANLRDLLILKNRLR